MLVNLNVFVIAKHLDTCFATTQHSECGTHGCHFPHLHKLLRWQEWIYAIVQIVKMHVCE
jgi:hypothetical protein